LPWQGSGPNLCHGNDSDPFFALAKIRIRSLPWQRFEKSAVPASFDDLTLEVASRYTKRAAYWYVRSKLRMDPVARKLLELASEEAFGEVLDVGCGRGQLGVLLARAGLVESLAGVDWDAEKVALATAAAEGLLRREARFAQGDVRDAPLPEADTVLLVDVLHYLAPEEQDAVRARAARVARRRVLVRDVDPDGGTASVVTRSSEGVTTSLGYNRGERVAPRSFDDLAAVLEREGFAITREPCSARAFANVLLVGRRP